jgi:hypothetical protein
MRGLRLRDIRRRVWDAVFKRLSARSGVQNISAYTVRHTIGTDNAYFVELAPLVDRQMIPIKKEDKPKESDLRAQA